MTKRRDWQTEYAELLALDRRSALEAADLERLGIAAFLAGQPSVSIDVHTRAHSAAIAKGDARRAARATFWIAFALIDAREPARAAGWVARGRRLLDESHDDCVECGYVLLPQALQQAGAGDLAGAEATFVAAETIGERFSDPDLTSLSRQGRGRVLVATGRTAEGLALFDEVMVSVTAGDVAPIIAGVVYCSVISACVDLLDVRRAQEWTAALGDWCRTQPGLVPYRGECLAHRAEIFRLHGQWPQALDEARRACDALAGSKGPGAGLAAYALAELHRLRGEIPEAEEAYGRAREHGRAPYPGLALLRLAQGQREIARAAIERAMAEASRGRQRATVLAAAVEILLAAGDRPSARQAADDLTGMAAAIDTPWLRALAACADGAVHLADGHAHEALGPFRDAAAIWRDLDAPYEAARVAVLVGHACRALGDDEGARMEWEASARLLQRCGATPALEELDRLLRPGPPAKRSETGTLTSREVEVLRLIARGKTNRAIAGDLGISEKTVARHISNIFVKLDLSTRAAATAYAFTHGLMS
jgi:DNA-binding CsgD family transcriptional regulator